MTTPREAGFYWVTYCTMRRVAEWIPTHGWKLCIHGRWFSDGQLDAIGPRVPTPEELASMEQTIAALRASDRKSRETGCWCGEHGHPCKGCELRQQIEDTTTRRCAEIADAVTATWNPIYAIEGSIGAAILREFNLDQEKEKSIQALRPHKWVGRQLCGMEDTMLRSAASVSRINLDQGAPDTTCGHCGRPKKSGIYCDECASVLRGVAKKIRADQCAGKSGEEEG